MTVPTIDPENVHAALDAALGGRADAAGRLSWSAPVYVALRRQGRRLRDCWRDEKDLFAMFRSLRSEARFGDADTLELCLTHDYRVVSPEGFSRAFANAHRGIRGIEVRVRGQVERLAPTYLLAGNWDFHRVVRNVAGNLKIPESELLPEDVQIRSFEALQFLVRLKPDTGVTRMHRGNRIVGPEDITAATIDGMIESMGRWMLRNVSEEGRMTYKYWPSRGEEAPSNNTIRQFMATLCLIRLAKWTGRAEDIQAAGRNLDYNLEQFFKVQDGVGTIEYGEKAKLGAAALAALAILEYPGRDRHSDVFGLLTKGIEALWSEDGSFRTFHKPSERNDNQNFYPGEALLFWARLYAHGKDRAVLERCMKSFAYYRGWHGKNRNPAFVPWHTQAYVVLYGETGKRELADFIFEMNDWLLSMQQWDEVRYRDLMGRFHDPAHPEYGPPHASSTGVYMEGLADAYALALETGGQGRAENYEKALWRGLRNIRQLQFLDDVDMFYISERGRVEGAVRTEAYNNEIRIDNIQHPLMALLKLKTLPGFKSGEG